MKDKIYVTIKLENDDQRITVPFNDDDLTVEENWNKAIELTNKIKPRVEDWHVVIGMDEHFKPVKESFNGVDVVRVSIRMLEVVTRETNDEIDDGLAAILSKQGLI